MCSRTCPGCFARAPCSYSTIRGVIPAQLAGLRGGADRGESGHRRAVAARIEGSRVTGQSKGNVQVRAPLQSAAEIELACDRQRVARRNLMRVRLIHSAAWLLFASAIVALPVTVWMGRLSWALALSGLVMV